MTIGNQQATSLQAADIFFALEHKAGCAAIGAYGPGAGCRKGRDGLNAFNHRSEFTLGEELLDQFFFRCRHCSKTGYPRKLMAVISEQ